MIFSSMSRPLTIKRILATALAASTLILSACRSDLEPTASNGTADTATAVSPSTTEGSQVVAAGTFEGIGDHVVTGSVQVVEVDGQYFIELQDDFSLDSAPDPKVGLGDGDYDPTTQAGHLAALTGASNYELPSGIDAKTYSQVYIWCERFSIPLGIASVEAL